MNFLNRTVTVLAIVIALELCAAPRLCLGQSPTPSPTYTKTPIPTLSVTPTVTETATPTPTATAGPSQTPTPAVTIAPTATIPTGDKICCYCRYQEFAGCAGKTSAQCLPQCSDGIDNDADGKTDMKDPDCDVAYRDDESGTSDVYRDCIWRGANGDCVSRFYAGCQDWMNGASNADCEVKLIDKTTDPINQDMLPQCKLVRFHVDSHGSRFTCDSYSQDIMGCLKCIGPDCNIISEHEGCSVFEDDDAVNAWVAKIQAQMGPNQEIIMSGNQTLASSQCRTRVIKTFTIKQVDTTYDKCHSKGDFCYAQSDPLNCTGSDGGVEKERCCCFSNGKCYFRRGGGDCPKTALKDITDMCKYSGEAYWCSDALKAAQADARRCLAVASFKCEANLGGTFQTCPARGYAQNNGFTSCTYSGECEYKCLGVIDE